MSTDLGLFNHIGSIVDEVGVEKTAAAQEKTGMEDPGGHEGPTTHVSKKPDEDEQKPAEGAQSADNTAIVKKDVPEAVDSQPEATPSNVPKQDDTQLGQGVDQAKATGEDSATESDYKPKPTGDKKEGDMGGTTHPADGSYGEKYSREKLASASDSELYNLTSEISNELAADMANGLLTGELTSAPQSVKAAAAQAGAQVAQDAGNFEPNDFAAMVLADATKTAHHQADLVADHLVREATRLQKAAMPMDPLGGESEGEDHEEGEAEAEEVPPEAAAEGEGEGGMPPGGMEEGGLPGGDDAAMQLLAAMGAGGGEELGGGGGEELAAALGGGAPGGGGEELAAALGGGGELGGGGLGGEELGGALGGAPPGELGGMGEDEAMNALINALLEGGVSEQELAAATAEGGPKLASAIHDFKRANKFRITEAKTAGERNVRDYFRSYVTELVARSRR
jgi:hypothetical protein